ncbi:signal peptidase II [Candidatus Uhrbacteria bacterium]|nr:signal peptidase II [Candidatus Uhrbacteria bacterium]
MKLVSLYVYWFLVPVTAIVIIDEWLKYTVLQRLPDEGGLVDPQILEFAIHKNWGLAFDIPFRLEFIILFSTLIGIGLLHIAYKNRYSHPDITLATGIIILGALGNLYDRVMYGFTVDYIILFARSAINLSDVVIVAGVILLLLSSRRTKNTCKSTQTNQEVDSKEKNT